MRFQITRQDADIPPGITPELIGTLYLIAQNLGTLKDGDKFVYLEGNSEIALYLNFRNGTFFLDVLRIISGAPDQSNIGHIDFVKGFAFWDKSITPEIAEAFIHECNVSAYLQKWDPEMDPQ